MKKIPLVYRIVIAFALGIFLGVTLSCFSPAIGKERFANIIACISPFGTMLVSMLKMVVIPIIFFSLATGAATLPLKKFGRMGAVVAVWYFATSLFAAIFGTGLAMTVNPQMQGASDVAASLMPQVDQMRMGAAGGGSSFLKMINDLFMNPFQALAEGRFLPIIVAAILFGLAARAVMDAAEKHDGEIVGRMMEGMEAAQKVAFKVIDWIMAYFPFGVLALTTTNFALYGSKLFGPYLQIAGCIILGVSLMLLLVYPVLIALCCRQNPYPVLLKMRAPILTAFVTRSSSATLPVSLETAKGMGINGQLYNFSLPLGATVNMDGVCVHLPVFAVLAANLFGVPMGLSQILTLILTVVFASVGAGGIPGGSIFLLFMVLENMGLTAEQTSLVVALAIGINPLMDMFETACNVAGDNVCTYAIAKRMNMMENVDRRG